PCATIDGIDLIKTHLAVPGSDECGADYAFTGKDNGAVVHHGDIITALHRLPTWEPAKTRDMASGVLFLGTYINKIHRLLCAPGEHGLQGRDVQVTHLVFARQLRGIGFSRSQSLRRRRW